jgi:hypothetical protein
VGVVIKPDDLPKQPLNAYRAETGRRMADATVQPGRFIAVTKPAGL